jgi:AcrR family transcriptional regulator
MRRSGRRAGSADTRGEILAAARQVFGEHGFENASVRKVAARAQVDPALVHHYFGTKQALFLAAMELPIDFSALVERVMAGPRREIGARLVRQTLELWEDPAMRTRLMGIVRSATTDEVAAEILRRLLSAGPILALTRASGQPDAALRATLAGSQIVGLAMARYVVRVEPLASAPRDEVVRAFGPAIQRYLAGRL